MAQPDRRFAIAAAVLGALALAAGPAPAAGDASDMSLGDPKAPVKMVEYASVSCGGCAAFNNEVFPAFKAKYVDTGKVHYTLREFLTPPEEVAAAGFLTARCAGPARYFAVVDVMFHGLEEIFRTGSALPTLMKAGAAGGLSEQQVRACISDRAAIDALNARTERAALAEGVSRTPTFFFNGTKVKEGPMTAAELDAAVAEASRK